jgi:hypothetical protein
VWTIPQGGGSVRRPQLSPDGTGLVYLLTRASDGAQLLHLLPLAGTTSVADGHDLPAAGDCGPTMWRFLDDRQLLALTSQGCGGGYDNLLVRYDLETRQVLSTTPLGLHIESLRAHGTRCLRRPRWRPRSSRARRPCLPRPLRGSGSARRSGR